MSVADLVLQSSVHSNRENNKLQVQQLVQQQQKTDTDTKQLPPQIFSTTTLPI
jgi:hypothetical protein